MKSKLEGHETSKGLRLIETLGPVTLVAHPVDHSEGIDFRIECARLGRNGPRLPRFL